jgi:hypothetical protein
MLVGGAVGSLSGAIVWWFIGSLLFPREVGTRVELMLDRAIMFGLLTAAGVGIVGTLEAWFRRAGTPRTRETMVLPILRLAIPTPKGPARGTDDDQECSRLEAGMTC